MTTTAPKEMGDATLLYDDVTGFELEEFVKKIKPDLVGSGIKEKYIFQKMGIPLRQMHSGITRPVPRLRRFRHLRPRHGHRPVQPGVEQADPPWKNCSASARREKPPDFRPPPNFAFATDEWRRSGDHDANC